MELGLLEEASAVDYAAAKPAPGPEGEELALSVRRYDEDSLRESERLYSEYGDVVALRRGPFVTIFLFHPDHARHVLVDKVDAYSRRTTPASQLKASIGKGLVTADKPEWGRMRKLTLPAFTRKTTDFALPMFNDVASMLVERMKQEGAGSPVNIHQYAGFALLEIIGRTLLGASFSAEQAQIIRHSIDLAAAFDRAMPRRDLLDRDVASAAPDTIAAYKERNAAFQKAQADFDALLLERVRQRRSEGSQDDLLSALLDARDEEHGSFSDQEVAEQLKTLVAAGHDTTMSTVSFTLYELARHPEAQQRVRDEVLSVCGKGPLTSRHLEQLKYTEAAISEAIRLNPPVAHIDRRAEVQDVISGFQVPKGASIALCPYVVQRRADLFVDPLLFHPERFFEKPKSGYYPFSLGPRICIGRALALVEAKLLVALIVREMQLAPVDGFELRLKAAMTVHPRGGELPLWVQTLG